MNKLKLILILILLLISHFGFSQIPYRSKDTLDYNRPINKTCSSLNFYYTPLLFKSNFYNYFYYNNQSVLYIPKPFAINIKIRNHY